MTWPKRLFVCAVDVPASLDLFGVGDRPRIQGFPNVLVTERFKNAVEKLALTNMMFEPVDLVS